jgi:uncharacterized protein
VSAAAGTSGVGAAWLGPHREPPPASALPSEDARTYNGCVTADQVRLSTRERHGIRAAVETTSAKVGVAWRRISLFGSRTDPGKKGGDIDLYVEIEGAPDDGAAIYGRSLRLALQDQLGERKVDLLIDDGHRDLGAFGEMVRRTKVDLWTAT